MTNNSSLTENETIQLDCHSGPPYNHPGSKQWGKNCSVHTWVTWAEKLANANINACFLKFPLYLAPFFLHPAPVEDSLHHWCLAPKYVSGKSKIPPLGLTLTLLLSRDGQNSAHHVGGRCIFPIESLKHRCWHEESLISVILFKLQ